MKFIDNMITKAFKNQYNEHIKQFLRGDELTFGNEYEIDKDTAMKYTAVFACIRVLSETLASTPIKVYRKLSDGNREDVSDSDIYDMLHNMPNEDMSPFNFKEMMMVSICLSGNAFAKKLRNAKGDIIGLQPYQWQNVKIESSKSGKLTYVIKEGDVEKTYTRKDIFHIPGMSYDGINGLSPIEYMNRTIKLGLSYEEFGEKFYQNGANASGVIEHPDALSEEAFLRFKKQFAMAYQGLANAGKPIILEGGAKFSQLTMKPADAQLIESKRFQIEDIARIYRVPLHLIQDLSRSTNNNIEHQSLEFVMYSMLPYFLRWEENINMQILTREQRKEGLYVEFLIDSLLRGDSKSRAEAHQIGRNSGYLSANDIRKKENMNPIPNGNIYLQPMNFIEAGTQVEEKEEAEPFQNKEVLARILKNGKEVKTK